MFAFLRPRTMVKTYESLIKRDFGVAFWANAGYGVSSVSVVPTEKGMTFIVAFVKA